MGDVKEAAVGNLAVEIETAWNTHDMARFARCFGVDADFVNVGGMWWRGRPEIEERHAESHRGRFSRSRIELHVAATRTIAPGVAVAHIRWALVGHEPSGPRRTVEPRHGIWTWVLRDVDGRVEIVAGHNTDSFEPVATKKEASTT